MRCENNQPPLTTFAKIYAKKSMIMGTMSDIPTDKSLTRVLVAVDGSDYAKKATKVAVMICKAVNAELVVFHAIPVPRYSFTAEAGGIYTFPLTQYFESARKEAQGIVDDAVASAKKAAVRATGLVADPTYSIVESIIQAAASHSIDLIVLGSRGFSGFKKLLIGSVSSAVVNHAHCSVLVVR
jgi:nucleotide-binding universal stress UspA family protein